MNGSEDSVMQDQEFARNLTYDLSQLLEWMLQKGASDLHLKPGSPPGFRVDGALVIPPSLPPMSGEELAALANQIVPEQKRADYEAGREVDFSLNIAGVSRYRVSVFRHRCQVGIVMRRIPVELPDLDRLGLPQNIHQLATLPHGLVLVTGPTGSGKSTTLAAMLNYLNDHANLHIVTLEDPVEFVHSDKNCFITQREIGVDSETFGEALRRVLRQDPDVIMIGELRDLETIALAITAAETGHLVIGTMHTARAVQTVDRVLDAFPPESQAQVRTQLSTNLQGVLSQTLVPKIGGGRCPAFEIMLSTEAIRSCIREGKTHQIGSLIQTNAHLGMKTLNRSLADLVNSGAVKEEDARRKAPNPAEFDQAVNTGGQALRLSRRKEAALQAQELHKPTPPAVTSTPPPPPVAKSAPPPPPPAPVEPAQPSANAAILEKLRRG